MSTIEGISDTEPRNVIKILTNDFGNKFLYNEYNKEDIEVTPELKQYLWQDKEFISLETFVSIESNKIIENLFKFDGFSIEERIGFMHLPKDSELFLKSLLEKDILRENIENVVLNINGDRVSNFLEKINNNFGEGIVKEMNTKELNKIIFESVSTIKELSLKTELPFDRNSTSFLDKIIKQTQDITGDNKNGYFAKSTYYEENNFDISNFDKNLQTIIKENIKDNIKIDMKN